MKPFTGLGRERHSPSARLCQEARDPGHDPGSSWASSCLLLPFNQTGRRWGPKGGSQCSGLPCLWTWAWWALYKQEIPPFRHHLGQQETGGTLPLGTAGPPQPRGQCSVHVDGAAPWGPVPLLLCPGDCACTPGSCTVRAMASHLLWLGPARPRPHPQ